MAGRPMPHVVQGEKTEKLQLRIRNDQPINRELPFFR